MTPLILALGRIGRGGGTAVNPTTANKHGSAHIRIGTAAPIKQEIFTASYSSTRVRGGSLLRLRLVVDEEDDVVYGGDVRAGGLLRFGGREEAVVGAAAARCVRGCRGGGARLLLLPGVLARVPLLLWPLLPLLPLPLRWRLLLERFERYFSVLFTMAKASAIIASTSTEGARLLSSDEYVDALVPLSPRLME